MVGRHGWSWTWPAALKWIEGGLGRCDYQEAGHGKAVAYLRWTANSNLPCNLYTFEIEYMSLIKNDIHLEVAIVIATCLSILQHASSLRIIQPRKERTLAWECYTSVVNAQSYLSS
jgi:hypothetical protein